MKFKRDFGVFAATLVIGLGVAVGPVAAGDAVVFAKGGKKPGGNDPAPAPTDPVLYSWMSTDLQGAWDDGFTGSGVTMTFVDDFSSRSKYFGNLGDGLSRLRHGEWTSKQGGMVAPGATIVRDDFYGDGAISLASGFNVLNLSYGWVETDAQFAVDGFRDLESSIIAASDGDAFIAKSAGNDAIAVGGLITSGPYAGTRDQLGLALIGGTSVIFVGALTDNGSGTLASYSNYAGESAQDQFLVVGVNSGDTGLAGTSFAAPIVAGYGAILASKFTTASPTQVADQLLNTASDLGATDVDPIFGRGEANLSLALSPVSIN